MAKDAVKWLIIPGIIFGLSPTSWAQDLDTGKFEFQSGCAPCHGSDGKGKGPVSAQLRTAPTDLTLITKKNSGVFPVNSVYEVIDGRKAVETHGTREMPIWGFRYMPSPYEAVNPSPSTEAGMRTRILAIIDYLSRIQEK
jgi:mono/diheme cytochrome c family protein